MKAKVYSDWLQFREQLLDVTNADTIDPGVAAYTMFLVQLSTNLLLLSNRVTSKLEVCQMLEGFATLLRVMQMQAQASKQSVLNEVTLIVLLSEERVNEGLPLILLPDPVTEVSRVVSNSLGTMICRLEEVGRGFQFWILKVRVVSVLIFVFVSAVTCTKEEGKVDPIVAVYDIVALDLSKSRPAELYV